MNDFLNEKFSTRAKNALKLAQQLSFELGSPAIGTEHLLYGITTESSSFASEVLLKNKLTEDAVRQEIMKANPQFALAFTNANLSRDLKKVLEKAAAVAAEYEYQFIGTEHFLYGIVDEKTSAAYDILNKINIDPSEIRKNLLSIFENVSKFPEPGLRDMTKTADDLNGGGSALDYFTEDVTEKAKDGKIDPLIGRTAEVERLVSILSRRTKNNPVLIGDPGVGKTAIVEGLALAIHERKVPSHLLGKKILALDLSLVVAGSMFRGEFENRLKQIIDEVKNDPNIILFIDELHTLAGAGATTGSLDAANILKPSLARGELRAIGATTLAEYKKHIETDAALERRFQPIIVDEPSAEETLKILQGLRANYEAHHGLVITDEALETSVKLAVRHIPDRFLPDKAIDIVDETAAYQSLKSSKTSRGLSPVVIEQKLADAAEQKKQAIFSRNFTVALALRNEEAKLQKLRREFENKKTLHKDKLLKITGGHIADTVSRITGIPNLHLEHREKKRLLALEKTLKKHITGQDQALATIASAVRRSRTGISASRRPIGSFMFLGPSGVGKTLTAKILAREIFGDEKALIRIDMSEFMERHNVARLTGAPAGYVGYEDGGRLTETVRRRPYAVVLFDEIEKAHPEIFNLLLQIFEEGELTDAAGRRVNFRNTIIIMTSNIGLANFNKWAQSFGFGSKTEISGGAVKDGVLKEVKDNFRPEFLNRVDKLIIFEPLGKTQIKNIIALELEKFTKKLAEMEIKLTVTAKAQKFLLEKSFDSASGARLVRKNIETYVEDLLAQKILGSELEPRRQITITHHDSADTLVVS